MRTMRTIRQLWLLGNAGLLASLVLHPPASIIVQGVADVLLAVAWIMVIYRACTSREWLWAVLMVFFPLVVWGYIFGLADQEPQPSQPVTPHGVVSVADQPTQPLPSYDPGNAVIYPATATWAAHEPLALRQARATIAEAERQYPDW